MKARAGFRAEPVHQSGFVAGAHFRDQYTFVHWLAKIAGP